MVCRRLGHVSLIRVVRRLRLRLHVQNRLVAVVAGLVVLLDSNFTSTVEHWHCPRFQGVSDGL